MPQQTRVQILSMLCEGSSMRSVSRVCDVSINTVSKLLVDAGEVCAAYHDQYVRGLQSKRVQCDEIWSFCYAKNKNVRDAKSPVDGAGDVWTWTALDADSKMIVSWCVGRRDAEAAYLLMEDLRSRLKTRVQLTTDGHKAYLEAVESTLGADVDYAMLVKSAAARRAMTRNANTAPANALERRKSQSRATLIRSTFQRATLNARTST